MWIKYLLFSTPAVFIGLLLFSSTFVPSTEEIATSEYRMERMVVHLGSELISMNPWLSGSATDSQVTGRIFEGLLTSGGLYEPKLELAKSLIVSEDIVLVLDPDQDADRVKEKLSSLLTEELGSVFTGFRPYDPRDFARTSPMLNINRISEKTPLADDSTQPTRLLFRLEPEFTNGQNGIPSAVDTQIQDRIARALGSDLETFKADYDKRYLAAAWYIKVFGIEGIKLPAPLPKGAATEKAEAHAAQWAELSKELTSKAEGNIGFESFDSYLGSFPDARVQEHPVIDVVLHDGVRWHDYGKKLETLDDQGQPTEVVVKETLDAEDVAFSFEFVSDPTVRSKRRSVVQYMTQIRVKDGLSLEIVYAMPFSPAVMDLAMYQIIPEHRLSRKVWTRQAIDRGIGPSVENDPDFNPRQALPAEELIFSQMPIGTGPFTMFPLNGDSLPPWRSGELVRLERFEDYWNPEEFPAYKYVDYYIFDQQLGQETASIVFSAGGIDTKAVAVHELPEFEARQDDIYLYSKLGLSYDYLAFNMDNELFKDKRVRQALTMGVDVEQIIKYIYGGRALRVSGPGYPILDYYNNDYFPDYTYRQGENQGKSLKGLGTPFFPFDLDEASALLEEAGWKVGADGFRYKDGKKFEFKLLNGSQETTPRGKIATLAIENWKALGLDVTYDSKEFTVFLKEHVYPRNFDMLVLGWSGGLGYDKRQLWHSKSLTPGGLNFNNYKNLEADKLMEALVQEYDADKILEMSHKLFDLIADDHPYIFLSSPYSTYAVDRHYYWNKPVLDEAGRVVDYEKRSLLDPELMMTKVGPGEVIGQWKRSREILFPHDPDKDIERVYGEKAREQYRLMYGDSRE